MSFQAQNFPGISKTIVLETNRNSSEPKKEKMNASLSITPFLNYPNLNNKKKKFKPSNGV